MKIQIGNYCVILEEYETYYTCYIPEHDLYFSTKINSGVDKVIEKAKAMVKMKLDFLEKFPEYKIYKNNVE